ncbi:TPA: 30S ribosomal protein S20 [Candidatus Saccharibacteria bacterium]|nr:MAG: 30S ribosomal protein S20 [Candidatus Saccharibacteria bacterium GW2011_GWA2_46_10]OGL36283.1 MAG: 30S ribosomal protein S20 [Candidatus Saccharibacteria bacterium RIFCSPHIGHO2_12_FULL_47_17]HCM51935.1 30S ribosomal protein S20 [Candidatus Saccharibacteria bacterium]
MPIIKSAKKRVKIAAKANIRNTKTRQQLRDTFKAFKLALESGKTEAISKAQHAAVSAIDIAAKKNVIHRNKAARKKSQLATMAKAIGVKPAKSTAKQSTVAKKATSRKPVRKTAKS